MNQTRHALFIQGSNAFIVGILMILIPLLLVERNIKVQDIGLIFAIMPFIFQIGRMVFGVLSDFVGRRIFYITNSLLNAVTAIIYYFASSPLLYAIGKLFEGLTGGSLWAVNRAFLLEQDRHKQKNLIHLRSTDSLLSAIGMLAAGFLLSFLVFENVLLFCVAISFVFLPSALLLKDKLKNRITVSRVFANLNLKKKPELRKTFLLLSIFGISNGLVFGYIFPVFLNSVGFSAGLIGVLLGVLLLISGISTYFSRRVKSLRKLIIISIAGYAVFLAPLGFSGPAMAGVLLLLFGISDGTASAVTEVIFSRVTDKQSYAGDVGLALLGHHFTKSITIGLSGFLAAGFGFGAVFLLSAVVFIIYSMLAMRMFE